MIRDAFQAMGTTIEVIASDTSGLDSVRTHFTDLERRLSRFRSDSELSLINASNDPVVTVSPALGEALSVAKTLYLRTSGAIDPAVGSAMVAWDYDRSFEHVTASLHSPAIGALGSWDIEGRRLTRDPGVILDLGGIAKGWAADRAVDQGMALLVSAGGDLRSALDETAVDIVDPRGATSTTVLIGPGGLATSTIGRRNWRVGDTEAHHIIEPSTMAPCVTPVISATASCRSAAEAEAAAKMMVIRGQHSLEWADSQAWVDAGMVTWHDGAVFATHGWEVAA